MVSVEDFVLGFFVGMGVLFTIWKAMPKVLRAFGYNIARNGAEKQAAVQRKAVTAVEAAFDFARAQADLAEEVGGDLPKDFDPAIHFSCQVAAAVERELIIQAEREGLIHAGLVDKLMRRQERLHSDIIEMEPEPPAAYEPEEVQDAPNVRRIRGRLLSLRRGKTGT